jgi:hypothetical protein
MPYAKHESFHIREGWLSKGMEAIQRDSRALRHKTAPMDLGLGRNMVRALRFWLVATGLTKQEWENQLVQALTPFGEMVWRYDRYLEDEGTLWLIHYHLACSDNGATAWYWFFNHFAYTVFDQETFVEELDRWAINHEERKPVARRTLERDFRVLVRTYLPTERKRSPEDLMESPLSELGLLESLDDRQYRLLHPDPDRLHPLTVLYVLLQRRPAEPRSEHQIGLTQGLREPMSVGRVFNLGAASLIDILNRLEVRYSDCAVGLVRTAGLDQLMLPEVEPMAVLERYYQERLEGERQ